MIPAHLIEKVDLQLHKHHSQRDMKYSTIEQANMPYTITDEAFKAGASFMYQLAMDEQNNLEIYIEHLHQSRDMLFNRVSECGKLLDEVEIALTRAVSWHQTRGSSPHGIDEMPSLLEKLKAHRGDGA